MSEALRLCYHATSLLLGVKRSDNLVFSNCFLPLALVSHSVCTENPACNYKVTYSTS
jgi:hypothetical protein